MYQDETNHTTFTIIQTWPSLAAWRPRALTNQPYYLLCLAPPRIYLILLPVRLPLPFRIPIPSPLQQLAS